MRAIKNFILDPSHGIKRILQRIAIANYKSVNRHEYVVKSSLEKKAVLICRNVITDKNSKLCIASKSFQKYIINDKLDLCIYINENSLEIVRSGMPQTIPISIKSRRTILNMFDGHSENEKIKNKSYSESRVSLSIDNLLGETRNLNLKD